MAINRSRAVLPVQPIGPVVKNLAKSGTPISEQGHERKKPQPSPVTPSTPASPTPIPTTRPAEKPVQPKPRPVPASFPQRPTVKRTATPARPRKPSAEITPVKPATQTQGRKKNDPWNSPW